jgi:hypothetical protein
MTDYLHLLHLTLLNSIFIKLIIASGIIAFSYLLYEVINAQLVASNRRVPKYMMTLIWSFIPLVMIGVLELIMMSVKFHTPLYDEVEIQLSIIFYFLYMIRDKSQVLLQVLLSAILFGWYSAIGHESGTEMIISLCSIVAIGVIAKWINANSEEFIDRFSIYFMTELIFGIPWILLLQQHYDFSFDIFVVILTRFVVLMSIIHVVNILIREQWAALHPFGNRR